jgi:hypothetical protein
MLSIAAVVSPALDECCLLCCDDGLHYLSLDQDLAIMDSDRGTLQPQPDTPHSTADPISCSVGAVAKSLLHVDRQHCGTATEQACHHVVCSCPAQQADLAVGST